MTNEKMVKLIDTVFTPEEAREVILGLLEYKVQYHSLKSLRTMEYSGKVDNDSQERIIELEESKVQVKKFFETITADTELKLTANIQVGSIHQAGTATNK